MFVLAHQYSQPLNSVHNWFRARVYGQVLLDGRWAGWLVFFPTSGGRVVATERETIQPSLDALAQWGAGLTGVYLQGALDRALSLQPEAEFAAELAALERQQSSADARADVLEREAAAARAVSRAAEAAIERTEERVLENTAKAAKAETHAHEKAAAASRAMADAAERTLRTHRSSNRSRNTKKKKNSSGGSKKE